ncbi:TetR/AcrR family transcriptional regulator [Embleya hyalina]|uniref:TetR family transcriptional regulator n=1 Tax=Embleya hyalina TaxID=516124 RepID=A0A401YTV9_9ACTN|nr:TetR/AcrR family transcriptional regulator [Embleya hyalina]GCD97985.1 TetR family transcriptional regulator [Embleya hyalina]
MTADAKPPTSARRDELLAASVAHVAEHGLAELSLRPLARAIGSSPRVLLYLFGSKEGLIREILEVGRAEQFALVTRADGRPGTARDTLDLLWTWLVAPERRGALRLFFDGYVRSFQGDAPWSDFAVASVDEWLPPLDRVLADHRVPPTLVLAVLRGLLLDHLAATNPAHAERVQAAWTAFLDEILPIR